MGIGSIEEQGIGVEQHPQAIRHHPPKGDLPRLGDTRVDDRRVQQRILDAIGLNRWLLGVQAIRGERDVGEEGLVGLLDRDVLRNCVHWLGWDEREQQQPDSEV